MKLMVFRRPHIFLAIEEANAAVASIQQEESAKSKRGCYIKLSDEIRAKIGKYSYENGDSAAARHFTHVLGKHINRSTVRGQELSPKRKAEEDLLITSLPSKKWGRPLLLEELDQKVQQYLRAIPESGGAVSTAIVLGTARGIILKINRTLLAEYGGHVVMTKDWGNNIHLVKLPANTTRLRFSSLLAS